MLESLTLDNTLKFFEINKKDSKDRTDEEETFWLDFEENYSKMNRTVEVNKEAMDHQNIGFRSEALLNIVIMSGNKEMTEMYRNQVLERKIPSISVILKENENNTKF